MTKARVIRRDPDELFATQKAPKKLPFDFLLQELEDLGPYVRPMFGCYAVYVDDQIVFLLRDKGEPQEDDGVWVATTREHHRSLKKEFPALRSITILSGGSVTSWQNLPVGSEDFEASVMRACELVRKRDPRIGKIPGQRGPKR